ncbi:MAG: ATP-binding protein [Bacteroidales bacterium]|nr:ATP-binding protein [Bacteroidales bacterium]
MERELYKSLVLWKKSVNRKPLILNGARQVGKTWLLKEFARCEYTQMAFFSLDRNEDARNIFEQGGSARHILLRLSALAAIDITPGDTLLILDEIQDCPQALTALKFFCEDLPEIHVAVAGSLLGVSLHEQTSFPVGKVDILRLYPLNFNEFLRATNRGLMADCLERGDWPDIDAMSRTYIDLLRLYYYVGGMPSVVASFIKDGNLQKVRNLQNQILADYEQDFSKHAPANEVPRLKLVWQSIPSQLAKENKKFIYGAIKTGARASSFEIAIQWLQDAGLVYKVKRVNTIKMPLKFYEEFSAFKLFMLDIGLMGAMVNLPAAASLVKDDIFTEYKGAFTELFVCSQLQGTNIPLFYHTVEASRIEIDFAIQLGTAVFPLEVKAEENVQSKSLRTFISKNPDLKGIRISMKPHIKQDWLECFPLYAFREAFEKINLDSYSTPSQPL